ncbi:MAG: efflux RND transporter periplasmic adaptor subunit [Planctomycetaceae bacterium]|nr:efflux RND transporter periplasmic adaptor subunit [Planctomycetaceae bacterium]
MKKLVLVIAIMGLMLGVILGVLLVPESQATWLRSLVGSPSAGDSAGHDAHDHGDEHGHEEHSEEPPHVELTSAAQNNLKLVVRRLESQNYQPTISVPAIVRERPGVSDLRITSQFAGLITNVHAVPGQALKEGDPLFDLRLTGETLAAAQSQLLAAIQQLEIVDMELGRITELAAQGGVPGKQKLELEYEKKRLQAERRTREQELLLRGLSEAAIATIASRRELITSMVVTVPKGLASTSWGLPSQNSVSADPYGYTVEDLLVSPGSMVQSGDELCSLAYHTSLFVEGQAFERDLPAVRVLLASQNPVNVELGSYRDHLHPDPMPIVHLANHVDDETGVYHFYIPLPNSVLQDVVDAQGRKFRTWQYKPGQRGHVKLPNGSLIENVFIVPRAALVVDGPRSLVYRRLTLAEQEAWHAEFPHDHEHEGHDHAHEEEGHAGHDHAGHDHSDHEARIFVPVEVERILETSSEVVLRPTEALHAGQDIAWSAAYQLHLAAQESAGGGGHHHDHDH